MTLIKSISGIRGTIGGRPGNNLTPPDVIRFASAFAVWIRKQSGKVRPRVVIGRDARISGEMVGQLVSGTLIASGINIIDLGMATTPTVEIAVTGEMADGGIVLTASHNPGQWNALKLLNSKGEFISAEAGTELLDIAGNETFDYSDVSRLGTISFNNNYHDEHIRQVMDLKLTDPDAIRKRGFRIAIDCINSVGGLIIPDLLKKLGAREIIELNCKPTGVFTHDPEPRPENLEDICRLVLKEKADLAFVVDPDVDRLAIITEKGEMFGEEYTLVAVADYVLSHNPGNTVSNLSSTRALRDVTEKYGGQYFASAVGEVNVVEAMKNHRAVIGGEGNGGVIYPDIHYGRDALVGIALFLSHLAHEQISCSSLRTRFPDYYISKLKYQMQGTEDMEIFYERIRKEYADNEINSIDGIRIDFGDEWVHLRKSNTEPVIRVIAESTSRKKADHLAGVVMKKLRDI
jgi:phosphomannomutase